MEKEITINEKELPIATMKIPDGETPDLFLAGYLGTLPTSFEDMPSDDDVEATVFVKYE